jgi:hypothetical protein
MKTAAILGSALLGLFGCDDPQYVNPDTVALIVTNDSTAVQRVNRCHYVPVLLGSQVTVRYAVEKDLRATITLTRNDVRVVFDAAGSAVATVVVPSRDFASEADFTADEPPPGFTVQLLSPCTPDDL